MELNSAEIKSEIINESIKANKMKLRKIRNAHVLLKNNYFIAKKTIIENTDAIQKKIIEELNIITLKKLNALFKEEGKIRDYINSLETDCNDNKEISDDELKITKYIENGAFNEFLYPFISLDFIAGDISSSKSGVGFLKTSTVWPEELKLYLRSDQNPFWFEIINDAPWHSLLIYSLSVYAEDRNRKIYHGNITDNKCDYKITFNCEFVSDFIVSATLYGRHIGNSPLVIKLNEAKMNRNELCYTLTDFSPKTAKNKALESEFNHLDINYKKRDSTDHESNFDAYKKNGDWKEYKKEWIDLDTDENIKMNNCNYKFCSSGKVEKCSEDENNNDEYLSIKANLIEVISDTNGVNLHFPTDVAVNKDGDIVICDTGNHRVWIIDGTGKPKTVFDKVNNDRKFLRPSSVVFQNRTIVIKDDLGLHVFDDNGIFIRSIGTKFLSNPSGLALTHDKNLVTLNMNLKPKLFVFGIDGRLLNCKIYEPLQGKKLHSRCQYMTTFNNEVIVSDLGLNQLYKTTLEGEYIDTFGFLGSTPGTFNEPAGIISDSNGNVLISDSKNDRIQIFDWNGKFLNTVKFFQPIRKPLGIALRDYYLYVLSCHDHLLGIYKIEFRKE